jgi:hypothetical protein
MCSPVYKYKTQGARHMKKQFLCFEKNADSFTEVYTALSTGGTDQTLTQKCKWCHSS